MVDKFKLPWSEGPWFESCVFENSMRYMHPYQSILGVRHRRCCFLEDEDFGESRTEGPSSEMVLLELKTR